MKKQGCNQITRLLLNKAFAFCSSVEAKPCWIKTDLQSCIELGNTNKMNQILENYLKAGYLPPQNQLNQVMKTYFLRNEFSEMNMLHSLIEDLPINITDSLYYTYLVDANAQKSDPDECVRLLSQCFLKNITLDAFCYFKSIETCESEHISKTLLLYQFYREKFNMTYQLADQLLKVLGQVKDESTVHKIKQDIANLSGNEYVRKRIQRIDNFEIQSGRKKSKSQPGYKFDKIIEVPISKGQVKVFNINETEMEFIKYMRKNGKQIISKDSDEEYDSDSSIYGSQDTDGEMYEEETDEQTPEKKYKFSRRPYKVTLSKKNRDDSEDQ